MKLKVFGAVCLSALAITWMTGCSAITDKAAEKATESMLEKATGAKNVDIGKDGGSIKVTNEKGEEVELSASENKIPEGFPSSFPIYGGATVASSLKMGSATEGKTGFNVVLQTGDAVSDVAKFYKREIPKSGYEISGTMELGDGTTSLTLKKGQDDVGNVMITSKDSKDGKTSIIIS
ncbi:MAG: hypothetical protein HY779_00885, partial [Rubrobacteridae bacterium]|nr:hypothetical protein [Rubrobacteridae bacterium]